jgi:hypothetical protein
MAKDRFMYGFKSTIKLLLQGGFMSTKFIDRSGMRFGKLVAVRRSGTNSYKKVMWECVCDCGNTVHVVSGALASGNTSSCGCVIPNFKHGGAGKGSYNTWRAMMRRCYKESDKDYFRYGGKGVTVCERWHDYVLFAADMGEPSGAETLDRKDVYGNYTPENCWWALPPMQARNFRLRENSKTGYIGVSQVGPNSWMAKLAKGKKSFYSKCFRTVEEAAAARKELERIHWGVA